MKTPAPVGRSKLALEVGDEHVYLPTQFVDRFADLELHPFYVEVYEQGGREIHWHFRYPDGGDWCAVLSGVEPDERADGAAFVGHVQVMEKPERFVVRRVPTGVKRLVRLDECLGDSSYPDSPIGVGRFGAEADARAAFGSVIIFLGPDRVGIVPNKGADVVTLALFVSADEMVTDGTTLPFSNRKGRTDG